MQQHFVKEIFDQPAALADLLARYEANQPPVLTTANEDEIILLTGMGASFHVASIAAYQLQRRNIFAQAVEATEILNYPSIPYKKCRTIIYISQSGSSGEVEPVFRSLTGDVNKIGITNNEDSPLAQLADTTLPLYAGEELTVATKTYINSLALTALMSGIAPDAIRNIGGRIQALLDSAEATAALWLETLAPLKTLYFVGHGPHGITARHCAMMVGEWAKRPAMYASIGAFRHGFLEALQPDMGVVIFAPAGVSQQSAYELADELAGYGVTVMLVENGYSRRYNESFNGTPLEDELLSPMLDAISTQLFVEALAKVTGGDIGFRYISKVVKQI